MFRRFFRHIKEGFLGVGRHFGMAFSSSVSVTIALILVGFFLALSYNLSLITLDIEESISLSALIDYSASADTMSALKDQIESIEGVKSVTYKSRDEEFTYYVQMYPEIADFNETYRSDNPFHDAFLVALEDGSQMATIKAKLEAINGIDSVHDGGDNTYVLINILQKARLFGSALVIALAVLAIYLIYNTISITITARDTEIWIMKNVGAKNSYIRAPFLVEGVIIGVMGSFLPILALIFGYLYLFEYCGGVLVGVFTLANPYPFLLYLSSTLLVIGIVVGYVGSFLSVSALLRDKR